MSEKTVKGIVLKTIEYGDYDKIVTIYSDKYGKLAFIALGVNKATSKNNYSLNTFSLSEFQIFKSRRPTSLSKLKTGRLLESNFALTKIYNNYLFASAICSLLLQDDVQQLSYKNYQLYEMLKVSLKNINENINPFSNMVWFIFYSLKYWGGQWNLSKCYRCNLKSKVYWKFDFNKYGLVCPNCFINEQETVQDYQFIEYLLALNNHNFFSIMQRPMQVGFEIIISKLLLSYIIEELGFFSKPIKEILAKEIYRDDSFNEYSYSVLTKPHN